MSDYVGKHLLVDCYGCKKEILLSSAEILNTMSDSAVYLGLNVEDTYEKSLNSRNYENRVSGKLTYKF